MHRVSKQNSMCCEAIFDVLQTLPTCCAIKLRNTLMCCATDWFSQSVARFLFTTVMVRWERNSATLLSLIDFKHTYVCICTCIYRVIGTSFRRVAVSS